MDTERNQPAFPGERGALLRCRDEGGGVGDVVIAGTDQHHPVGREAVRSERNGGGGVARARFDQDRDLGEVRLALDMIEMRATGHDHRRAENGTIPRARERLLEQRFAPDKGQKRLGPSGPAARPEPRAAAATQDYRRDKVRHANLHILHCKPKAIASI